MTSKNLSDLNQLPGQGFMPDGSFLTFDPLIVNRFSLLIPSLPNVTFFMQRFELPSVTVNEVTVPTSYVDMNEVGEKVLFSPFNVYFLVDKFGRNWTSCFNWMKEITVSGSTIGRTDDVVLMIDGKEFIRFYGAWPSSLSGLNLSAQIETPEYLTSVLTLNYDYFEIINEFATTDSVYS